MRARATAQRFEDIHWPNWVAEQEATLLFVVRDAEVLLIRKKRGIGAGKINGPGGKVDPGETPEQCAVRECQEELHITPQQLEYCGRNLFQFVDGYSIDVHCFRCDRYDGVPTETREALPLWTAIDDIPYEQMWEDDRIWLPKLIRREPFVARYIFDGDKMVDYAIDDVIDTQPE